MNPQLSDLTSSNVKVPTIKGPIYAEYKQVQKYRDLFIIELPANMEGEFVMTSLIQERKVERNGEVIQSNDGVVPLNPGENQILIYR